MINALSVNIADQFRSPFGKTETVGGLVGVILQSAFVIAGVFVLIMFLVAGFSLISSSGDASPETAQKSKNAITAAVTGFIVVFAAYWIVRLIEVLTGTPFITQPTF